MFYQYFIKLIFESIDSYQNSKNNTYCLGRQWSRNYLNSRNTNTSVKSVVKYCTDRLERNKIMVVDLKELIKNAIFRNKLT